MCVVDRDRNRLSVRREARRTVHTLRAQPRDRVSRAIVQFQYGLLRALVVREHSVGGDRKITRFSQVLGVAGKFPGLRIEGLRLDVAAADEKQMTVRIFGSAASANLDRRLVDFSQFANFYFSFLRRDSG